jgi:tetratricopeptide (TPR) repeat protein
LRRDMDLVHVNEMRTAYARSSVESRAIALQHAQIANGLDPDLDAASVGYCFLAMGQTAKAIECLTRAVADSSPEQRALAHYNLAMAFAASGDIPDAIGEVRASIAALDGVDGIADMLCLFAPRWGADGAIILDELMEPPLLATAQRALAVLQSGGEGAHLQ